MVISLSTQDQSWNPGLMAEESEIKFDNDNKFLGVTISNKTWFKGYIDNVVSTCTKRNKIIPNACAPTWGNDQKTQKTLYPARQRMFHRICVKQLDFKPNLQKINASLKIALDAVKL